VINLKNSLKKAALCGFILGLICRLYEASVWGSIPVTSMQSLILQLILWGVGFAIVFIIGDVILEFIISYKKQQSTTVYKLIINLAIFVAWAHCFIGLLDTHQMMLVFLVDLYLVPALVILLIIGATIESFCRPKTKTIYDSNGDIISTEIIN
jgi:hypothetical protein